MIKTGYQPDYQAKKTGKIILLIQSILLDIFPGFFFSTITYILDLQLETSASWKPQRVQIKYFCQVDYAKNILIF